MECSNCKGTGKHSYRLSGVVKTSECLTCLGEGQLIQCMWCQQTNPPKRHETHRCFFMVASETADPEKTFRELCQMHDLTYNFSDDSRYWRSGSKERDTITAYAAVHLKWETAVRIWNEVVDTKISEGHHTTFYWGLKGNAATQNR